MVKHKHKWIFVEIKWSSNIPFFGSIYWVCECGCVKVVPIKKYEDVKSEKSVQ